MPAKNPADRKAALALSQRHGEVLSTHNRQDTAIANGRTEAQHDEVDLVVHGRDGRIRSKDSYGNDPLPPRDREH